MNIEPVNPAGSRPLPLVTIGVALYNHERYIETCLQSLLAQTYPNLQIIVIDDGSPDRSHEVARRYLENQGSPPHCTLVTRPNRGMCNTLNEIARLAKGTYISFIGSDDYWMPGKIADQVAYLEAHPEITLVHSNSIRVNAAGEPIKNMDYSAKINSGNVFKALVQRTGGINTPSHLFRTGVFGEIGYYDPSFRFEDTDFWLRLTKDHLVGYINTYHTYYRWHGDNLSNRRNALLFYHEELIRIYRKNIEDPDLRRQAIRRIYRKSFSKSLNAGRLLDALSFLFKVINPGCGKPTGQMQPDSAPARTE